MNKITPLKVLHIVGAMNRAGTETMLMNLYRNINLEKIQFDFISYSQHEAHYDKEIIKLGGRVIRLSKTQSIKEIYDAIKKYGPYDVVHSHTLFHCGTANLAALLAGVKVRISHAHTTLDNNDSYMRRIYSKLMRLMIKNFSTNLLACSNGAGSYLYGEKSLTKKKYSYFPNLIDYSSFLKSPIEEVKKFKAEEELESSIVIGHIGRFMEAKNHLFLIEIMKSVLKKEPNYKLLLVGDGELKQQIQEKAKVEGIYDNIKFAGIREDIPTLLHSMDVFVFPSLYEGLGLVLLEAQASGVPCLVSDAIQPEADLNIGLVSKLKLIDGPDVWANKIIELANKKEKDISSIIQAFEKRGYSLSLGMSKLLNIYNSKQGETNEKNINCLL